MGLLLTVPLEETWRRPANFGAAGEKRGMAAVFRRVSLPPHSDFMDALAKIPPVFYRVEKKAFA